MVCIRISPFLEKKKNFSVATKKNLLRSYFHDGKAEFSNSKQRTPRKEQKRKVI